MRESMNIPEIKADFDVRVSETDPARIAVRKANEVIGLANFMSPSEVQSMKAGMLEIMQQAVTDADTEMHEAREVGKGARDRNGGKVEAASALSYYTAKAAAKAAQAAFNAALVVVQDGRLPSESMIGDVRRASRLATAASVAHKAEYSKMAAAGAEQASQSVLMKLLQARRLEVVTMSHGLEKKRPAPLSLAGLQSSSMDGVEFYTPTSTQGSPTFSSPLGKLDKFAFDASPSATRSVSAPSTPHLGSDRSRSSSPLVTSRSRNGSPSKSR